MLDHLPERDRPAVKARLRRAWNSDNHTPRAGGAADARRRARALPSRCGRVTARGHGRRRSPSPAWGSVGAEETLESTNPCESMIESIRRSSRNVKHWQIGDMCLRWTAAGMLEAETQFRKHHRLHRPREARPRCRTRARQNRRHTRDREDRYAHSRLKITPGPSPKFHANRDILRSVEACSASAWPCPPTETAR